MIRVIGRVRQLPFHLLAQKQNDFLAQSIGFVVISVHFSVIKVFYVNGVAMLQHFDIQHQRRGRIGVFDGIGNPFIQDKPNGKVVIVRHRDFADVEVCYHFMLGFDARNDGLHQLMGVNIKIHVLIVVFTQLVVQSSNAFDAQLGFLQILYRIGVV